MTVLGGDTVAGLCHNADTTRAARQADCGIAQEADTGAAGGERDECHGAAGVGEETRAGEQGGPALHLRQAGFKGGEGSGIE